jgi:hypothetical protein
LHDAWWGRFLLVLLAVFFLFFRGCKVPQGLATSSGNGTNGFVVIEFIIIVILVFFLFFFFFFLCLLTKSSR